MATQTLPRGRTPASPTSALLPGVDYPVRDEDELGDFPVLDICAGRNITPKELRKIVAEGGALLEKLSPRGGAFPKPARKRRAKAVRT